MFARLRRWLQQRALPRSTLVRDGDTLELRFVRGVGQSRMAVNDPERLLIPYTRTMLAVLALHPAPRRIAMVGLGGGSQVKVLHRHLPQARIDVLEINPQVIARRDAFRIPPDDDRLRVHRVDAAGFLADPACTGRFDVLLVDGYDAQGIPEALSTEAFYRDCRRALAPGGVLASNLFCAVRALHAQRLRAVFGADNVCMLDEPEQSNRVAVAWTAPPPATRHPLPPALEAMLGDELRRLEDALRCAPTPVTDQASADHAR